MANLKQRTLLCGAAKIKETVDAVKSFDSLNI